MKLTECFNVLDRISSRCLSKIFIAIFFSSKIKFHFHLNETDGNWLDFLLLPFLFQFAAELASDFNLSRNEEDGCSHHFYFVQMFLEFNQTFNIPAYLVP